MKIQWKQLQQESDSLSNYPNFIDTMFVGYLNIIVTLKSSFAFGAYLVAVFFFCLFQSKISSKAKPRNKHCLLFMAILQVNRQKMKKTKSPIKMSDFQQWNCVYAFVEHYFLAIFWTNLNNVRKMQINEFKKKIICWMLLFFSPSVETNRSCLNKVDSFFLDTFIRLYLVATTIIIIPMFWKKKNQNRFLAMVSNVW